MSINYAEKYSTKIDERFKSGAYTNVAINHNYDFVGVQTVKVYSVPVSEMNDYKMTGSNRYGEPDELGNELQEMTMTQDRAFTFTIDRRNYTDTMMVNAAGQALQRQIDEVIIPELDVYRLSVMAAKAGTISTPTAITEKNAYSCFLDATVSLTDNKVPTRGTVAYVTPAYYKALKLDDNFIKSGDLSQKILLKGQIGEVDGIPIITVPTSYLPENIAFMLTNPIATTSPVKLSEYKVHDNPPGINGWLVEGRVYYDAFVLNNKKKAIYVHKTA